MAKPAARAKVYSRVEPNPFTQSGQLRVWIFETKLGGQVVHTDDAGGDFQKALESALASASAFSFVASTGHSLGSWNEVLEAEDRLAGYAEPDHLEGRVERVRERFARRFPVTREVLRG